VKLLIQKAVYGGAGLGHVGSDDPSTEPALQGKTVFVPHTLPCELVECEIIEDKRSFVNARLTKVLEPAAQRIAPGCEYFPRCGGCQYQHATYEAQLAIKRDILAETLSRAGIAIEAAAIAAMQSEPWQYRNRVRLHIRFGDFALCYRETASHRDVVVDHCPIAAPLLQQAIESFPEAAQSCGLDAGTFDEAEFFTNDTEDTLLIALWTTRGSDATRALQILCDALQEQLPMLAGGVLFQSESQKGQGRQQANWGKPELTYRVGSHRYRVNAASFFQVNRFLVPHLVERVTAGRTGQTAWDLFAGAGLFSVPLSHSYGSVTAVEQAASSVRDLRHNLQGRQHRIVASSTLDFLKSQVKLAAKAPSLVVVDPPRAGLGKDATALLSQIGPAAITYISCDPATLARDVQQLLHSGYHLTKITLVDLFPQTYHLETIAELIRG
jgi:23S rRNA (uracil1939-C5)-methyltransferase